MRTVSVIIPNYNGEFLLKENLPGVIAALIKLKCKNELIVVDDCSTDGSVKLLKNDFPSVKVIRLDKNKGFSSACNAGIAASIYEIVYLLNSDVSVPEDFLDKILPQFEDNAIFAAGSIEKAGKTISLPVINIKWGMFYYKYCEIQTKKDVLEAVFVSAGHSAYAKEKLFAVGGFKEIYNPYLWEDMDVCYRAWKKGWKSVYVRGSAVVHERGGTIKKVQKENKTASIHWRNRFLFLWGNFSLSYLIKHFILLPGVLFVFMLKGKTEALKGFFLALGKIKEAFKLNERIAGKADKKIISRFKDEKYAKD
ncbi:MAG: glycosyltransferase [Candidatus Firestonebacteria bacterium]